MGKLGAKVRGTKLRQQIIDTLSAAPQKSLGAPILRYKIFGAPTGSSKVEARKNEQLNKMCLQLIKEGVCATELMRISLLSNTTFLIVKLIQ